MCVAKIASALAGILLFGCAPTAGPETKVDARATVPTPPDASSAADGAGPSSSAAIGGLGLANGHAQGKCGEIETAWTERRAAGGHCARAADCACYTASLWAPFGQAATDVATAKALGKLVREFSNHRCPTACAQGIPDRCKPDCVSGRCTAIYLPPYGEQRRRRAR